MKKIKSLLLVLLCLTLVFPFAACKSEPDTTEIKVGVLKGATGIGAVKLKKISDDKLTVGNYDISFYETANVKNLTADIINGTVNIAALPINTAATLFNNSDKVQIIAANALGVLSIVGKDSLNSISDLRGKTIHTTGQAATPEYILNYILTKNGLNPKTDVTIKFYADGTKATAGLVQEGGYAMLPEPATTAALVQNNTLKLIFSVTDEWNKVSDTKLIQGCLVVNKDFAKAHKGAVDQFLKEYAETVEFVNKTENIDSVASLTVEYGIIPKAPIAKQSIPRCNIVCITGKDMKKDVSAMLKVLFDANPDSIGKKLPEKSFYYL